jgi:hypothetical protein
MNNRPMEDQIVEIVEVPDGRMDPAWINALEAGKVLYFRSLAFVPRPDELRLFKPEVRDPKSRNISLDAGDRLKGAAAEHEALAAMMSRFRDQVETLLASLAPRYTGQTRRGLVSFRPTQVETRVQSWRADDRRLHVDAFPSRPNRGERLLRVFSNVNPEGVPRVWRVGEPFEDVAERFLPQLKRYSAWQAKGLHMLGVTKSLRSEYDHLMLQLHDAMKSDAAYQQNAPQVTMPFPAGSTWVCFSDQTSHAAMSGQYVLEQTVQLPPAQQYDPDASPLAILSRMMGRGLI